MVSNPYKVLGVSENATPDEIKKAYRKRSKECHPDLHPDDPHATEKMNEVNEAYDMLTHPEKYAARQAQQNQYQSNHNTYSYTNSGYSNSQNGYRGSAGSYSSSQNSYGSQGYQRQTYQGSGGWSTSGYGDFDFFDFFNIFSGTQQNVNTAPQHQAGDSAEIRYVIDFINSKKYQDAISLLIRIPSTGRNARWFYLSALANNGIGNTVRAKEHIQKAVELDPNNPVYKAVLRQVAQGSTYSAYTNFGQNSYGGQSGSQGSSQHRTYYKMTSPLGLIFKIFMGIMIFRFMATMLYSCMGMGYYMH